MIKIHRQIIALLAVSFYFLPIKAQTNFIVLEKNLNFRASDLVHELNAARDSLIIKTNSRIKYVYSINESYKREIFTYVGKNSVKLALKGLTLGKHVMVVNYKGQLLVFVLKVFAEEPDYLVFDEEQSLATSN